MLAEIEGTLAGKTASSEIKNGKGGQSLLDGAVSERAQRVFYQKWGAAKGPLGSPPLPGHAPARRPAPAAPWDSHYGALITPIAPSVVIMKRIFPCSEFGAKRK